MNPKMSVSEVPSHNGSVHAQEGGHGSHGREQVNKRAREPRGGAKSNLHLLDHGDDGRR
jgi:hypothetical protein